MARDFYDQLNRFLDRNRVILWAAVALLVAAGFGFTTPQSRFAAIDQRVSNVEQHQEETAKLIRSLARAKCIETDRQHWALYDLPCRKLLGGDLGNER